MDLVGALLDGEEISDSDLTVEFIKGMCFSLRNKREITAPECTDAYGIPHCVTRRLMLIIVKATDLPLPDNSAFQTWEGQIDFWISEFQASRRIS